MWSSKFNEQIFLGSKCEKWWKQAKLHFSTGWTSISWSNNMPVIIFFLHTGHIAPPKMPFQNKLCCWSSLSWDSLLKNSSLLWGNTKQTLTTVEQMFQLKKIPKLGSDIPRPEPQPQRLIFWYGCYEIKAPSGFQHIVL